MTRCVGVNLTSHECSTNNDFWTNIISIRIYVCVYKYDIMLYAGVHESGYKCVCAYVYARARLCRDNIHTYVYDARVPQWKRSFVRYDPNEKADFILLFQPKRRNRKRTFPRWHVRFRDVRYDVDTHVYIKIHTESHFEMSEENGICNCYHLFLNTRPLRLCGINTIPPFLMILKTYFGGVLFSSLTKAAPRKLTKRAQRRRTFRIV